MLSLRLALAASLALAFAACDGGSPADGGLDAFDAGDEPADSGVPGVTVDLGTGQETFELIPRTGAPSVQLVHGPQGGYHVWGRVKVQGFQPDLDIWFVATRLTDGAVLHDASVVLHRWIANGVEFGLQDLGGGWFTTAQAELIILAIDCAPEIVGQQLRIQLFVRERATGRVATDERTVTVVRDLPSDPCPDF